MGYVCFRCGNCSEFSVFYDAKYRAGQEIYDDGYLEVTDEELDESNFKFAVCDKCGSDNVWGAGNINELKSQMSEQEFNDLVKKIKDKYGIEIKPVKIKENKVWGEYL